MFACSSQFYSEYSKTLTGLRKSFDFIMVSSLPLHSCFKVDIFEVEAVDLGELTKIEIGHDGVGHGKVFVCVLFKLISIPLHLQLYMKRIALRLASGHQCCWNCAFQPLARKMALKYFSKA